MAAPVLRTRRLVLRPFEMTDAPALHETLSDADSMKYWGDRHRSLAETEAFVRATRDAPAETTCDFVITLDGRPIGKAGMWEAPEIGFFVAPGYRREGYAREAVGAVIGHLFATRPLTELTADVDPRNAPSLKLLESLGFRETGRAARTMQVEGAWCDSVYLALRRADWRSGE